MMAMYLRALGVLLLALGLGVAAVTGWLVASDAAFREIAAAYARHPEHALFQADYWRAAGRHYGLFAACIGGLLGGLTFGGILLALAELLRRTSRR
jgi:hypothetical protein